MGLCVFYEGDVPTQLVDEFKEVCVDELGNHPEEWDECGHFNTDGWNHRGWEGLLNAVKWIASTHNVKTELHCSFYEDEKDWTQSYYCDGDVITEECKEEETW